MSLYKYLIILSICTGLCWLAWFFVLFFVNPFQAGFLALIFFYVSLTFALIGTFSILGFLFRWRILKTDELAYKGVNIASRQSVLFTLLIIAALILQSQRYLTWWILLILIVFAGLIELFFISYKKFNK